MGEVDAEGLGLGLPPAGEVQQHRQGHAAQDGVEDSPAVRLPGQDVAEGGPVAGLAVLPVPVRAADSSVPLQGDRDHEEDGAGERGPVERVVGVGEEGQQPVGVEVGPEPGLQHRHHQVQTVHNWHSGGQS